MITRKLTWTIFSIFVISAFVLGSAIQARAQTSLLNEYTAAWNSHDAEKVVSFFTDDIVYEDLAFGRLKRGKKEVKDFIDYTFATFPDLTFELTSAFISGSWYCGEWVWTGTHKGDIPGLPATGKKFTIRGVNVGEIRDGKIKRHSDYYNLMDFMREVGVKLVPASSPR